MHILHVVGTRPNFMKAAPVVAALQEYDVQQTIVHTGQHHDAFMSDVFFQQLGIPQPDVNLAVRSGAHTTETAEIMTRLEPVILERKPDLVLLYGDGNATVAATLVCAKRNVRIGHVEAGLRSFDRTTSEEVNRLLTDQLASLLFTPSEDGDMNLLREGVDAQKIYRVGNVMIDTLIKLLPIASGFKRSDDVFEKPYALVTLHQPSNVDEPAMLERVLRTLAVLSDDIRVVFPVHPRTRQRIESLGGWRPGPNVLLADPAGYIEFLALQMRATVVVTDSGSIQEETTYLGVPCLTVRWNTERPITTTVGTNLLVGDDMTRLLAEARAALQQKGKKGRIPELWDGRAAYRIAEVVVATHIELEAELAETAGARR